MTALFVDSSTEYGIVVLYEGLKVLFEGDLPKGHDNSKFLAREIQRGLEGLSLAPSDLEYIAVGIGPGSYTGIRVGVMVGKALAYACKIPLVGVSSLEGFVPSEDCAFAAIIDAKIGGAYYMIGQCMNGIVTFTSQPEICELKNLSRALGNVTHLVTPKMQLLKQKLDSHFPLNSWEWEETSPNSSQLIASAQKRFLGGDFSKTAEVEILYLRRTQAEIERAEQE